MNDWSQSQVEEHQKFLEFCALYSTGTLTDEQVRKLERHLAICAECRTAFEEFHEIESIGVPALAPYIGPGINLGRANLPERTDAAIERLLAGIEEDIQARSSAEQEPLPYIASDLPSRNVQSPVWRQPVPYAGAAVAVTAALCLVAGLTIHSYRLSTKKISDASAVRLQKAESKAHAAETQFTELSRERAELMGRLERSAGQIDELSQSMKLQALQIASLTVDNKQLVTRTQGAEEQVAMTNSERDGLIRKLQDAQLSLAAMQKKLDAMREEQAGTLLKVSSLEKQLNDLSSLARDRNDTIQQQQDLLSYDRDIRDLIGARDLYVAEVTDVGRDGESKKPFGRVFFTKGKSLIFYAYDLDRQPGLHRASATTFQAWGRVAQNFNQALPLGILYLDNSTNKRWVLKFDDPKTLAKIDGVFVTVEPKGGSRKPSGKPVLFAYLKVEPNHP